MAKMMMENPAGAGEEGVMGEEEMVRTYDLIGNCAVAASGLVWLARASEVDFLFHWFWAV